MEGIKKKYEDTREFRERMEELQTAKLYFAAGDIVQVKHDISDVPKMLVQSVDKQGSTLLGISCMWFGKDGAIHMHQFNSKDLEKMK